MAVEVALAIFAPLAAVSLWHWRSNPDNLRWQAEYAQWRADRARERAIEAGVWEDPLWLPEEDPLLREVLNKRYGGFGYGPRDD